MLQSIWIGTAILALISIGVMIALMVRRWFIDAAKANDAVMQKQLRQSLMEFTAAHDEDALSEALSQFPAPLVIEVCFQFVEVLRGDDREQIVRVLAAAGYPDEIRRQLLNGQEAQKLSAIERLTSFPYQDTRKALLAALNDRKREVRIAASIALARLDALPPLAEAIARIGVRGQRSRRLIELFRSVPTDRSDEMIALATNRDLPDFVRAAAVDALGHTGQFGYIAEIEALLADPHTEVQAAVIRALGLIGHPRSADTLLAALDNPSWEVRLEAASAAGRLGLSAANGGLARLLNDDEWIVRYTAAKSLSALGDEGQQTLVALSQGPSSRTQRSAAVLLAEENRA
ncbi:HEAT repeat domain-containing protein [Devosia sp. J2-20]|uniref:HEAT repeat domain-containing protein n=1 Tax=Devosia sp. J2-20 TaxID=3026161 RepID=UPI00249AE3FA|nr:HEAT repeat domain-containing protein [Devosia sp. J2-20]WDQ98078.1 HEAT repeat domain-containing protein [Devosia sp. J2-20]